MFKLGRFVLLPFSALSSCCDVTEIPRLLFRLFKRVLLFALSIEWCVWTMNETRRLQVLLTCFCHRPCGSVPRIANTRKKWFFQVTIRKKEKKPSRMRDGRVLSPPPSGETRSRDTRTDRSDAFPLSGSLNC